MGKRHNSVFWELSKPNQKVSYLFGSMHVRDQRVFNSAQMLEDYISKSEAFFTEIDLGESAGLSSDIFELPGGLKLNLILGEKKYNQLAKILKKAFEFDLSPHNDLLPLITLNKIAESLLFKERSLPLDAFLYQQAKVRGVSCFGLEKLEDQIEVLAGIPLEFQLKKLWEVKRNPQKFRHQVLSLMSYYEEERIDVLFKATKKSLGKYRAIMLYNRNWRMADAIKKNISKPSFYVVGAAHLAGAKGLLTLLKRDGYHLKPIRLC